MKLLPNLFSPFLLVISSLYKLLDLTLKSPRATNKRGSFEVEYLKLIQNGLETIQNRHMIG